MAKKPIEDNILHTLMDNTNSDNEIYISKKELAKLMGYKRTGGALTLGLKLLISTKKIVQLSKNHYKVLV